MGGSSRGGPTPPVREGPAPPQGGGRSASIPSGAPGGDERRKSTPNNFISAERRKSMVEVEARALRDAKDQEDKQKRQFTAPHGFGSLGEEDDDSWKERYQTNIELLGEAQAIPVRSSTAPSQWYVFAHHLMRSLPVERARIATGFGGQAWLEIYQDCDGRRSAHLRSRCTVHGDHACTAQCEGCVTSGGRDARSNPS